ncbi:hypothetical protein EWM64_g9315 [Hericium alpestre]|uniref:Fungal-type protein kinase domain-containing protein n=1 Tax=Hericium alpestre TaxID=135208 RepID=A0A4Y9ZIT5_9AGAM|nr:hypothetical protein EWM64_g9315 [Hericium alpestre]
MGTFQDRVDVEDFVEAVWRFKRADLKLETWDYIPAPKTLEAFEDAIGRGEVHMHDLVCDLLRDAYQQAKTHLKLGGKSTIELACSTELQIDGQDFFQHGMAVVTAAGIPIYISEGYSGTGISPDLEARPQRQASMSAQRPCKSLDISQYLAGGRNLASHDNRPIATMHTFPPVVHTPTTVFRHPAALDSYHDAPTGSKRKAVSGPVLPYKARRINESSFEPTPTLDTLSSERLEEVREAIDPSPDSTVAELTHDELVLGSHVLELMSQAGNRRYITAILIRGRMMSLWYYNRMGVFKSQEFNFTCRGQKPDPSKLLLVAVALSLCDRDHFGYEPLLRYPSSDTGTPTTVKGADLVLPAGKIEDRKGQKIANKVSLKVRGEALHIQYGIVGRGTVVLSVMPLGKETLSSKFFTVPDLVAKLSWPVATRTAEDTLIRKIRAKLPAKWRNHLPDLQCSATLDEDDLHLPRTSMSSETGSPEPRVLRILVCARALPLYKLRSLADFKKVFLDFVRCHRVVYKKARVLHRDLSVNNVMFRLSTAGVIGVLNDWDLSEDMMKRESDDSSANATARHRTGTAPFMALELLQSNPPRHLYRHDLESFINILIWCAVHFDFDGTEPKRPVPEVEPWLEGDWQDIWKHKSLLFNCPLNDLHNDLYAAVRPKFRPILNTWIVPLVNMLKDAYKALEKHKLNTFVSQAKNQDTVEADTERKADYSKLDAFVFELEEDEDDNGTAATQGDDDDEQDSDDDDDCAFVGSSIQIAPSKPKKPWNNETLGGRMTFKRFMAVIGENPEL